jgi:hypothetical protein
MATDRERATIAGQGTGRHAARRTGKHALPADRGRQSDRERADDGAEVTASTETAVPLMFGTLQLFVRADSGSCGSPALFL